MRMTADQQKVLTMLVEDRNGLCLGVSVPDFLRAGLGACYRQRISDLRKQGHRIVAESTMVGPVGSKRKHTFYTLGEPVGA